MNANGSTDAESGIASYTFDASTQPGNQLAYTFGAGGIGSGSHTVHSTNGAGLDSANGSYTITSDSTAPAGGSLTVNGGAALPHERLVRHDRDDALQRRGLGSRERSRSRFSPRPSRRQLRDVRVDLGHQRQRHATTSRTATATASRSRRPTTSATPPRSRRRSRSTRRHLSRRRSRSLASRAATRTSAARRSSTARRPAAPSR